MIIVASGIASGRVRTTTTTVELPKMGVNNETQSLSLSGTSLIFDIHVMTN